MPMFTRKRLLLFKKEATYGLNANPVVATNAILCRDIRAVKLNAQYAERRLIRPWLGHFQRLASAVHRGFEVDVELAGAGAAGTVPKYAPLLQACGFSETITPDVDAQYKLVSDNPDSGTAILNVDGVQRVITGCRGSVSIVLSTHEVPLLRFRFLGLYAAATDAALGVPTLTGWQKPLPVNNINTNGFALHGFTSEVLRSIEIDQANQLVFRSLVGDVSGFEYVHIADRQPAGKVVLEQTRVAQKDWEAAIRSNATGAFQVVHGTVAGNIVQISAPAVTLAEPEDTDEDGIVMGSMGLRLEPTAAGNDEFKIVVK